MPDPLARLRRTRVALGLLASTRDAVAVTGLVTVAYLAVYLVAVDDLVVRGGLGYDVVTVSEPFARMVERTGPATFEPVALLDLYVVRWLVSPLNTLVGFLIAVLVGANLGLTYLLWRRPRVCGIEEREGASRGLAGLVAAVPALLSGTACCGPVVLLVLGIQASGALLTAFAWLLPAAVVLLLGSLVLVAGAVNPAGAAVPRDGSSTA